MLVTESKLSRILTHQQSGQQQIIILLIAKRLIYCEQILIETPK